MMKKILIIIYILIFACLSYYVTTLFTSRDHSEVDTQQEKQKNTPEKTFTNTTKNNSIEIEKEITDTAEVTPAVNAAYSITKQDCVSKCTNIENTEEEKYCNQVCGLSTNISTDSCDDLSDLEKDYCIKNNAITKKNINECLDITDPGIKKQCQNRVNEDFMDEVM